MATTPDASAAAASLEHLRAALLRLGSGEVAEGPIDESHVPGWSASDAEPRSRDVDERRSSESSVARAVLALPWPRSRWRRPPSHAVWQCLHGTSEECLLERGGLKVAIAPFAYDPDAQRFLALDRRDPSNDPLSLTVWNVDHDGSSWHREGSLGEVLASFVPWRPPARSGVDPATLRATNALLSRVAALGPARRGASSDLTGWVVVEPDGDAYRLEESDVVLDAPIRALLSVPWPGTPLEGWWQGAPISLRFREPPLRYGECVDQRFSPRRMLWTLASAGADRFAIDLIAPLDAEQLGAAPIWVLRDHPPATRAGVLADLVASLVPTDPPWWVALPEVLRAGLLEQARRMLRDVDPNAVSPSGATPLAMAAVQGALDVAHELIERGADPTRTDREGYTALSWAAFGGHPEMVESLRVHFEPLAPSTLAHALERALEGCGRVRKSATTDHAAVLRMFLQCGAPHGWANAGGETIAARAWRRAVELGEPEASAITQVFLEHGADPDAGSGTFRAWLEALKRDREELADLWITAGASRHLDSGEPGPLHLLASRDAGKSLARWVERGFSLEHRDAEGRTALHVAAAFGAMRAIRALADLGADLASVDRSGRNARTIATLAEQKAAAALLETLGVPSQSGFEPPTHAPVSRGRLGTIVRGPFANARGHGEVGEDGSYRVAIVVFGRTVQVDVPGDGFVFDAEAE